MNRADLTPKYLKTAEDIEQYLELIRKVWGEELGIDKLAKKLVDYHPRRNLKNFYFIKDKDRMVSRALVALNVAQDDSTRQVCDS